MLPTDTERLARRIERMVEAGRITSDEARRLRAAKDGARDQLIRQIRVGHAQARLDAAVAQAQLTREEADETLRRLAEGGSPLLVARRCPRLRSWRHG